MKKRVQVTEQKLDELEELATKVGEQANWRKKHCHKRNPRIELGEVLRGVKYRGAFKTVRDKEHTQTIGFWLNEILGMAKVVEDRLSRSSKTILDYVHDHDKSVERNGFYLVCGRVKSILESQPSRRKHHLT